MTNLECNAISAVQITHHFLQKLIASGQKGCFVYTSSASAVLPSPFSVLYAGTKAFLSMFAASLAPEVKPYSIDVLAVHPSPVASRCGRCYGSNPETLPSSLSLIFNVVVLAVHFTRGIPGVAVLGF